MGEQSVSAMIPILISDTSGASLANTDPIQPVGSPLNKAANPNPLADFDRKSAARQARLRFAGCPATFSGA